MRRRVTIGRCHDDVTRPSVCERRRPIGDSLRSRLGTHEDRCSARGLYDDGKGLSLPASDDLSHLQQIRPALLLD